jgi:hypothetical protein
VKQCYNCGKRPMRCVCEKGYRSYIQNRRFKSEKLTCVSAEIKRTAACVVIYFRDAEGKVFRDSYGYNYLGMVRRALRLERDEDFAHAAGREVIGHFNVNGSLIRVERR